MRYYLPLTSPSAYTSFLQRSVAVLLACFVLFATVRAQKMFHSIGPNLSVTNIGYDYYPYVTFSYTPRLNFYEKKNYSVSVGMPVNAGLLLFSSPGSESDWFYWEGYLVSVPAVINVNWGAGATRESSQKTGFFAGAGLGYLYRSFDNGDYSAVNGLAATANTGLRISAGRRRSPRKKHVEFRFSFTQPMQKMREHVIGFHVLFCRQ